MDNYKELIININDLANKINDYETNAQERLLLLNEKTLQNEIALEKQQSKFNQLVIERQDFEKSFETIVQTLSENLKTDLLKFVDGVIKSKLEEIEINLHPIENKLSKLNSSIQSLDEDLNSKAKQMNEIIDTFSVQFNKNVKMIKQNTDEIMKFDSTTIEKRDKYSNDDIYNIAQEINKKVGHPIHTKPVR